MRHAQISDPLDDREIRILALELAIKSHGESPGAPSDKCFVARARIFEAYLRGDSR